MFTYGIYFRAPITVFLPVTEPDAIKRAQLIDNQLQKMRDSTLITTNYMLMSILGLFPAFLIRLCYMDILGTVLVSNFPGYQGNVKWGGHTMLVNYFSNGCLFGDTGEFVTD